MKMIYRMVVTMMMLLSFVACGGGGSDDSSQTSSGDNSLNGTYYAIDYDSDPWTGFTSVTFDGSGNGNYQRIASSDDDAETGSFSYSVSSDGRVTISADTTILGVVSSDGKVIELVDTDFSDGTLGVISLIKQTATSL